MAAHLEPLHRGLHTSRDRAFLPEGALVRASNARYKPGDFAIWQAEGREQVAGGGHGQTVPLVQAVSLSWDPEQSTGSGVLGEREQIFYLSYGSDVVWRTIPAKSDAADPAMLAVNSQGHTPTSLGPMGPEFLEAVAFENKHFLVTGGTGFFFERTAAAQTLRRHGLPSVSLLTYVKREVAGNSITITKGIHTFWITWYDSVADVEGTADYPDTRDGTSDGYRTGYVSEPYTRVDNVQWRFRWVKSAFDAAKPAGADYIRIYKSLASGQPATIGLPKAKDIAYPIGYQIAQVHIASQLSTETYGGTTYYYKTQDGGDEPNLTALPSFPIVVVSIAGEQASAGRNGEPPAATSADVFEDSLVMNDVNDKRKVRFSYTLEPHAFPSPFYINFETKTQDEIIGVRALGQRLGVVLKNSIWRVNWLPNQGDADFARGRVKDVVCEDFGADSPRAFAKFDMPGMGPMLAFANSTGVYTTDLYTWRGITNHIDFTGIYDPILVNNPDAWRLELYYRAQGEVFRTKALYLHYHTSHLTDGDMAVTGPIDRPGGVVAAIPVRLEGGKRIVVTADRFGSFYYDGRGYADEAPGSPTLIMDVESREIYPAGMTGEIHTRSLIGHLRPSDAGEGTYVMSMLVHPGEVLKTETITRGARALKLATGVARGESVSLRLSGASRNVAMGANILGFEYEHLGESERRS